MADATNSVPVKGIIYGMPVRKVQGKKDPSQTYEFRSLLIEAETGRDIEYTDKTTGERKRSYKRASEIWKFDLERWLNLDDYSEGDPVEISYSLRGQEYKNKEGQKEYITKLVVTDIKFADIVTGDGRKVSAPAPKAQEWSVPEITSDDENLPF